MNELPGPLRHTPPFALVGRERELALLRALLPQVPGEPGRLVLVSGEPGAGKTRLMRELGARLADQGASVLYGACDTAVRVPYRPFLDALAQVIRRTPPEELEQTSAGELARLLPGPLAPDPGGSIAGSTDPDTERHRLHVAVADLLAAASRRSPLLLVLEDIHWADVPTLLLLRHLARSGTEARILVLATYRDVGEGSARDLTDTLIEIRRSEAATSVHLSMLSGDEITEFVRRNTGVDPAPELVTSILELTGGNAFLVTELWRELVEGDSLTRAGGLLQLDRPLASMAAPDSVRDVLRHRLERLGPVTTRALEIAAVAGSEFELATLRRAAGLSEGELLDAVDEAERHGLIGEIPAGGLAYRFSHELLRLAVIDGLSAARRAAIHLRVAEALAADDPGLETSRNLAALAHHYAAAAPVGGREPAVRYSLLAARAAAAALAFDESAEQLRTALALGMPDPAQAADAYLELGYAYHRAGKVPDALSAFRETAGLARQLDDPQLLARAAIGYEEACWRPAIHDGRSVALLEEAAAALGPEDSEVRTRLLGGLGRALAQLGDLSRAHAAGDESIAMARRRGDRRGLALTLAGSWGRSANTSQETNTMLKEALAIGEELGDEGLRTEVIVWLVPSFIGVSDHDQARRYLAQLFAAARRQHQPFHLHVAEHYDSALALCDGDLAHADAASTRSYEWSRLLTGRDASGSHGVQMFNIRREQGRLAELAPLVRLLAGKGDVAWRPGLAALLAELGMTREAKRELTRVVADLSGERKSIWLAALVYLTDCAAALDDESAAEALYAELVRLSGRNVLIGHLVACMGAADRYLGMLASVLGDWELAEQHFEAAAGLNRHLAARTWLAHTFYEHGRMLLRRGRASDRQAAAALMAQALGIAEPLGLTRVTAAVRATGTPVEGPHDGDEGLSAREREVLRLVAQGRSNREIGSTLFISEHTTASHVRNILRKTGCTNRTEAAAYAHRCGLLD